VEPLKNVGLASREINPSPATSPELIQLQENLTHTNNILKTFLKAISDIVVVIDRKFNIILSNRETFRAKAKCHKKIFNSDTVCPHCPALAVFKMARPFSLEKKHNGQFFSVQAFPVFGSGDNPVENVLEICYDITQQEQIKAQLLQSYKLASLGKLVAGVAHEINNPNTFIRGNINIISEAFRDILPILDHMYEADKELKIARLKYPVFKENIPILIEDMVEGANRVKKIVDGLRDFAKKDEGLFIDDVDVNYLIQNNLRITAKTVRKHAKMQTQLDTTIPTFKGNSAKIEQVLMNVLMNAALAIEKEDGLIFIETFLDKATHIVVKVRDNGQGMDEATQKQMFEPFFTTRGHKGGTGLGLSISSQIIQEHNGKIAVQSQLGVGTTITLSFPIHQNHNV